MFISHPKGGKKTLYELEVNTYPTGMVFNYLNGEWEERPVYTRSPDPKEQYWERPIPDFDYKAERKDEKQQQERNPEYVDPKLERHREEEWDRRINGFWFMNNGTTVYITGLMYFYLVHWRIDSGYPNFRMADVDYFYFLQYCIDDPDCLGMLDAARRRSGKALPLDVEIPTLQGFRKMQDLKVGDFVFGANGEPVEIDYISPIHYNHDVYEIEFNDGAVIKADSEHQWEVTVRCDRKKYGTSNAPKRVLTTRQLLEGGVMWHKEFNYQTDIPNAAEYPLQELPIDPYLFGVWIGDGGTHAPTLTSIDEEILSIFRDNYHITQTKHDGLTCYIGKNNKEVSFRAQLSSLGFQSRGGRRGIPKHIPEQYKIASVEQRLSLLRGIMDADGCIDEKGHIEFCASNNEVLARDVLELARSLGVRCTMKSSPSKLYKKDCGIRYRIYMNTDICVFNLSRKRNKQGFVNRTQNTHEVRRIVRIDRVENEPTKCISVKSDRRVYIASRDYILTHNTYKGIAFIYEYISRTCFANGGIQSKTFKDAGEVYTKLLNCIQFLPDYFTPLTDTEGGKRPKGGLFMRKDNKKGSKSKDNEDELELISEITYKSSDAMAYDGWKLKRGLWDEEGKSVEVDVADRWDVVKFCFTEGSKTVLGKSLHTTTVEEMENGGAGFVRLWRDSDPRKRNKNNRTPSGLYRYFTPSFENDQDFIDEYGYCDSKASKEFQLAEREGLRHDTKKLASYIRKNPFTIEEAFYRDGELSPFDVLLINQQLDALSYEDEDHYILRGDFVWNEGIEDSFVWNEGIEDSFVIFVPNSKGKFFVNKLIDVSDPSKWNKVSTAGRLKIPMNKNSIQAGTDPFDHNIVDIADKKRMSDGAGYVFHKFDCLDDRLSETFLVEYIFREYKSSLFYEDMLMMCHFFGCPILCEDNKIGIINHFEERGYARFLTKPKGTTKRGVSASPKSKEQLVEITAEYVVNNVKKVVFKRLLNNWLDFDPSNSTAFDGAMGAGWALVAAYRMNAIMNKKKKPEESSAGWTNRALSKL